MEVLEVQLIIEIMNHTIALVVPKVPPSPNYKLKKEHWHLPKRWIFNIIHAFSKSPLVCII